MRLVSHHLQKGQTDALTIQAADTPRLGEAHHRYDITGLDTSLNPHALDPDGMRVCYDRLPIIFHNSAVPSEQPNGLTMESLLAICQERLAVPATDPETLAAQEHLARAMNSLRNAHIRRARERAYQSQHASACG